jgi:hypothetical protein
MSGLFHLRGEGNPVLSTSRRRGYDARVESEVPDIDALVAQLRLKVEERRRSGYYPPGLEEDMTAHARRMLHHHTRTRPRPDLQARLHEVAGALPFDAGRIPAASSVPGGELVHKGVAKLVSRQTQGALQEVEAFARPVRDALAAIVEALEGLAESVRMDIDALYERQAAQERVLAATSGLAPDGAGPQADG